MLVDDLVELMKNLRAVSESLLLVISSLVIVLPVIMLGRSIAIHGLLLNLFDFKNGVLGLLFSIVVIVVGKG